MADGWALETALLSGCYAVAAAAAAAAGRSSVSTARGNTTAPPGTRDDDHHHHQQQPQPSPQPQQGQRRSRRGKQRRAPGGGQGDDDRMSFSTAGAGGSYHSGDSAHTGSTVRSASSSAASFGSCLSRDNHGRQPLPMCPDDATCTLINAKEHIAMYAHTCRLPLCASAQDPAHCFYFAHPGQEQQMSSSSGRSVAAVAQPPSSQVSSLSASPPRHQHRGGGGGRGAGRSVAAVLAIPSASTWTAGEDTNSDSASPPMSAGHVHADLRPNAPKARPLVVTWSGNDGQQRSVTVHGEWGRVKVHTLRQYLRQLTGIAPPLQVLSAEGPAPQPPQQQAPASPPTRALMGRGRAAHVVTAAQHDPVPSPPPPPSRLVVLLTDDLVTVAEAVRPIKVADANIVVAISTLPSPPL